MGARGLCKKTDKIEFRTLIFNRDRSKTKKHENIKDFSKFGIKKLAKNSRTLRKFQNLKLDQKS